MPVARHCWPQIRREFSNVMYWPSYETATPQQIYCADGRHIFREGVQLHSGQFLSHTWQVVSAARISGTNNNLKLVKYT